MVEEVIQQLALYFRKKFRKSCLRLLRAYKHLRLFLFLIIWAMISEQHANWLQAVYNVYNLHLTYLFLICWGCVCAQLLTTSLKWQDKLKATKQQTNQILLKVDILSISEL